MVIKIKFKLNRKNTVTIATTLFIVDQLIKHNVKDPVLNFGASFGILQGARWLFILVSMLVIGYLYYLFKKTDDNIFEISYALIISGAASNLIDRLFLGYVIDYIPFPFWPTFNLADVAIFIGIALLVYKEFIISSKKQKSKKHK